MTTLRDLRKKTGLTQAGFAFFATGEGESGNATVSKWESGKLNASRSTVALYIMASMLTPEQMEEARRRMDEMLPPA
ncbi:hypothetical protein [Azospirillum sp. sgz302134]